MAEPNITVGSLYNFEKGWIVGNFLPTLFHSEAVEIAIQRHQAGTRGDNHIHKIAREYNIVVEGEVCIDSNITIHKNGFWITEPNQSFDVYFRQYTTLVVIKTPSVPGDKYPVQKASIASHEN